MQECKLNLAIIGLGNWGKKILLEFSRTQTITTCHTTGNSKNRIWLKNHFSKIKFETNVKNILNNKNIDAVIIASPIKTHKNLIRISLLKGKHVFVEKPLSENANDSQLLINLAKKKQLHLFVGNIFLFHPVFEKLKILLSHEKIKSIHGIWLKTGTFKEDILLNLLYHELCIVQEFLGQPKKITIKNSQKFVSCSDILNVRAIYANKINCDFYINRISNIKNKSLTIITDKNCYIWENDELFKFLKRSSKFTKVFSSKKTALENECKFFIKSLSKKPTKFEYASQSLNILKTLSKIN